MPQENLLARYSVLNQIGHGALTRVYAARDRETGAVVALKRLEPALSKSDASLAQRFVQAARSARRLKHGNIVQIYDAGEAAGTAYVAMEMVEGRSVRDMLAEGPFPLGRAIRLAHGIASGLAHAHLDGVVHGGLKPSSILVSPSGEAKIADFGIGRLGRAAPQYVSPEQLRGGPVDHRSDVYSLGAVLYEMLTQRPVQAGPLPPPSQLNPNVPRAVDAIVLGMLAAQPSARPAGAPIVIRDLQRLEKELGFGAGEGARTGEPAATVPQAEPDDEALDTQKAIALMERESKADRSPRSRPAIFAALAVLLATLGLGIAAFVYYSPELGEQAISAIRGLAGIGTPVQQEPKPPAAAPVPPAAAPAPLARAESVVPTAETPAAAGAAAEPAPPPAAPVVQAEESPKPAAAAEPASSAPADSVVAPEQPAPAAVAPASERPRATQPAPKVAEQPRPAGTAKLIVAVTPGGELYIDGTHHGTTPPMTTFELQPGLHRIEVRSPSRSPYVTYMTVEAGETRRITHDFDAKLRPPS